MPDTIADLKPPADSLLRHPELSNFNVLTLIFFCLVRGGRDCVVRLEPNAPFASSHSWG
jgi:hypothetical protein